jgi:hypothetical protein
MSEGISPMTTEDKLHERRAARIAAGREAWTELNKHEHFGKWLAIADALVAIREEAMEQAGNTNRPQGPPYRKAFKAIITQREPWAAAIKETVRTHCYWLVDNLVAVQRWRETLAFDQRDQWNHPTVVKRNYERLMVVKEQKEKAAPNARVGLQDQVIRLQEENDMLRRRQGSGFRPSATPEEAAEQVAGHHRPEFMRKMAKALVAIAEREERQDRIERPRTERSTNARAKGG